MSEIKKKKNITEKELELISLAESTIAEILNDVDLPIADKYNESKTRVSKLEKYNTLLTENLANINSKSGAINESSFEEQLRLSRERIIRLKDLSTKLLNESAQSIKESFHKNSQVIVNDAQELNSFSSLLQASVKSFNNIGGFNSIRIARQGFPKRELLPLMEKTSLTMQELSGIMHISERTLQRYDDDTLLKTEYAEKAIELVRLYARGEEVFSSIDKFKLWMKSPSFIFNGESPISLLDTSAGFDMIFKELGRIEHGIFA